MQSTLCRSITSCRRVVALVLLSSLVLPGIAQDSPQTPVVESVIVDGTVRLGDPAAQAREQALPAALPFPIESYRPRPLPKRVEPAAGSRQGLPAPRGQLVTYDLRTFTKFVHPPEATIETFRGSGSTQPGAGAAAVRPDDGRRLRNFSTPQFIGNPEDQPWRRSVKLFQSYAVTGNFVCSGTLIDPLHVITAGHCVFDRDDPVGWAQSLTVVPGYENGVRPWGSANAVQLHSYTGWTVDGSFDHDIGIVDLDRPVGAIVGWRGFGFDNDCGFFTGNTHDCPGYPAESPYDGQFLYNQAGNFDDCENLLGIWFGNEVSYDRRSFGGQSGSGAYARSSEVVYSILSNGNDSTTWCVRIVEDKFNDIGAIIAADVSGAPDLAALDVNVAPGAVRAGDTLAALNYLVLNHSSAPRPGTFNASVYLSTNATISSSDTLLQTHSVTFDLAPRASVRVNVAPTPPIPAGTPTGSYWIGVILDSADANTANNAASGDDAVAISVLPVGCNGRALADCGTIFPSGLAQLAGGSVSPAAGCFFTVQAAQGGIHTFTFCRDGGAADYDTWLCLYDAAFNLITEIDDSCGLLSEITADLAAGTYRLGVSGFQDRSGSFTLAYSRQVDCNGRGLTAGGALSILGAPQTVSGATAPATAVVYDFGLSDTATCVFTFCSAGGTADYDSWLCLYDASFNLLASNDDFCGLSSEIAATLVPGAYHVAVSGFQDRAGSYSLAYFRFGACNGRSLAVRGSIDPQVAPQAVSGVVSSSAGEYFELTAPETRTYTFTTCSAGGTADYDAWLCLYDGNWDLVAQNDDTCGLFPEVVRTLGAGVYRIAVSGYFASAGSYTLAYSSLPTCNGRQLVDSGTITPTPSPQLASGSVTVGAAPSYDVSVTSAGNHTFTFCGAGGGADYDTWLCLYDAGWTPIAGVDDSCGLLSELTLPLSPGTYHLAVSGFGGNTGSYTLAYFREAPSHRHRAYDCNNDGLLDLSDPVCHLRFLFQGGSTPVCQEALNFNGDGARDISDPIAALIFLFGGGPPPAGGLGCREFASCPQSSHCS